MCKTDMEASLRAWAEDEQRKRIKAEEARMSARSHVERFRAEAAATVASIRTRLGQIDKACANWTADSVYQIERATGALRTAALDLENALRGE